MAHQGIRWGRRLRHSVPPVPDPDVPAPTLVLLEPLGAHTWKGLAYDGTPVAARWLSATTEEPEQPSAVTAVAARTWPVWTEDATAPPTPSPFLLPLLGLARTAHAHWLLSELDDGVPLRRLVAAARLTPLQAAVVLDDVHAALQALHREGHWHGRVHAGNVHIGTQGQVRLGDWAPAMLVRPAVLDGHRTTDLAALARLAGELAASASRPQHPAGSRAAQLLEAVQGTAVHTPPPTLVTDPDERARAAAELATVAQALQRVSRPLPVPPRQQRRHPSSRRAAEHGPVPAQRQRPDPPRDAAAPPQRRATPLVSTPPPVLHPIKPRRPPRMLVAAVTLVVLGAAVLAELVLLGPHISANWKRLTAAPANQSRDPRQVLAGSGAGVPTPAPAAAGPVTGVAVRQLAACRPGQVCQVRVLVRVWPDNQKRMQVHWTLRVIDRCSGAETTYPGSIAGIPPGADRVDGLSWVPLPAGRSLAVVAVTEQPAKAASPPLLIPAQAGRC